MKVPKPVKVSSGNYFIRLRLNGVNVNVTGYTEKECKDKARLIKAEYLAGKREINIKNKNVEEMSLHDVLKSYIDKNKDVLSPATVRGYTIYADNRFPKYRDKCLKDINWQQMINDELKYSSEKTVKNAWGLVSPALKSIDYPVPNVKLSTPPVNEIPFLQPEEIKPFCDEIKGKSYEIAALLELHGLRLSEIRGLTWKNIDLKRDVITVKGAMVRGLDGDVQKPQNKNRTSTRPVPIMIPQLHDALAAVSNKTGQVVTHRGGSLLDDIKRACTKAGITVVSNHGLRHSFASLCFFLNIPLKQIQEWGGWKDSAVLTRIYIRLSATMKTENQKSFTKFFDNSSTDSSTK